MCGKRLRACFNCLKWGILICICVLACLCLYWWALAPIISRLFVSVDCVYQGLEYYSNNAYLRFEDGEAFHKVLTCFEISEKGKPVDFYYVDNYVEDNPLRGKMCDIYALDVVMSSEAYMSEKSTVKCSAVTWQGRGDFISYALPYDPVSDEKVIVVSFCEKAHIVRYIMITEFDTTDGFDQVFSMHANLDWSISDED